MNCLQDCVLVNKSTSYSWMSAVKDRASLQQTHHRLWCDIEFHTTLKTLPSVMKFSSLGLTLFWNTSRADRRTDSLNDSVPFLTFFSLPASCVVSAALNEKWGERNSAEMSPHISCFRRHVSSQGHMDWKPLEGGFPHMWTGWEKTPSASSHMTVKLWLLVLSFF